MLPLVLCTLLAAPARAALGGSLLSQLDRGALPGVARPELRPGNLQRPRLTTQDAIREAEERYGGRAVGAWRKRGPGGPYYEVRLLGEKGKVTDVEIR